METREYITGKEFSDSVKDLNTIIGPQATLRVLEVVRAEVMASCESVRFELHTKLEKTFKATEEERMQAMTDLERRITKAIAENTERDTVRFRWVMGSVLITTVNLIALLTLYFK